jgi:hypothetical protein
MKAICKRKMGDIWVLVPYIAGKAGVKVLAIAFVNIFIYYK